MKLFSVIFVSLSIFIQCVLCHKIDTNLHRERASDGAFAGRGEGHESEDDHDSNFDHESILGSYHDADEFDHLPASESKKRLAVLLEKIDEDGDSLISSREMQDWILRSFVMLSSEESEERFEETDENSDNSVTWAEHLKETYGVEDPSSIDLSNFDDQDDSSRMMREDKDLFTSADADGNGELSKEEFLAFSHPEEDEKMIPILIKHAMAEKDKDNDGLITFKEFLHGQIDGEPSDETLLSEKERFDEDYDKNMDGVLDRVEIRHWLVPDNHETAATEVKHLFATADENEDGILSFTEILDNHDVFVGSEVTDYGEHLHNMGRFQNEL